MAQGIALSLSWIFPFSHQKRSEQGLWFSMIWKVYGINENVIDEASYTLEGKKIKPERQYCNK